MNKIEEEKLLQLLKEYKNKNICMNINEFMDILKDSAINKNTIWNDFQPIFDMEILKTGHYGKVGETNLYCSCIVGPGNFRISKISNPLTCMSDFRKDGDDHVNRIIEENWSEEIAIVKYGEE